MINEEGFTIDRKAISTIETLQDLNILLDNISENGARYLFMILAENRLTKEIEVLINQCLKIEDLVKISDKLEEMIKIRLKENKCECDKCKKSIEILRNKYKFLEE